jgi:hypothetical protein
MSTRGRNKATPAITPNIDHSKLGLIRSGKKKKTVTGFKAKKDVTILNDSGQYIKIQKEKKFEETGVTKKKRNFIEFESILGTNRQTDLTKIGGPVRHREIEPRVEDRIVQKKKRKEYLDNYQYHETKNFSNKDSRPSIVIHQRLGDIYGATVEETQYIRTTYNTNSRPSNPNVDKNRANLKQAIKQNRSVDTLRNRPQRPSAPTTATTTKTTTTRVGRRTSGPSGPATTTTQTKTTTRTTTSRVGGNPETKTRTTTSTTRGIQPRNSQPSSRGRK